jgi:ribosomal protein S18 acetylase RimI-like enzyme
MMLSVQIEFVAAPTIAVTKIENKLVNIQVMNIIDTVRLIALCVIVVIIAVAQRLFGSNSDRGSMIRAGGDQTSVPLPRTITDYHVKILEIQSVKGRTKKDINRLMKSHRGHITPWDKFVREDTDWTSQSSPTYLVAVYDDGKIIACARYFAYMYRDEPKPEPKDAQGKQRSQLPNTSLAGSIANLPYTGSMTTAEYPGEYQRINFVHVLPTYRGRGIAKLLFDKLLENTRGNMCLMVESDNVPAMGLYNKYGFKAVAKEEEAVGSNKTKIFVEMVLRRN